MARVIIPEATSGKCFTHKEVFFRPSATVRLYYWPKLKVQLAKMIKVIENCRWRPKGISEGVTPALSWPLLGAFLLYSPLFTSIPFQDQKLAMNGFDQVSRHISELSLWLSLLNLLNQWNMASFIGDFLFSREAAAKCNREVGSQIENLRVVIAIADERFILLDSFHRSAYYHL